MWSSKLVHLSIVILNRCWFQLEVTISILVVSWTRHCAVGCNCISTAPCLCSFDAYRIQFAGLQAQNSELRLNRPEIHSRNTLFYRFHNEHVVLPNHITNDSFLLCWSKIIEIWHMSNKTHCKYVFGKQVLQWLLPSFPCHALNSDGWGNGNMPRYPCPSHPTECMNVFHLLSCTSQALHAQEAWWRQLLRLSAKLDLMTNVSDFPGGAEAANRIWNPMRQWAAMVLITIVCAESALSFPSPIIPE